MIFDVDCLTSWLDFCILFIPEVRLFNQVLAETKVTADLSRLAQNFQKASSEIFDQQSEILSKGVEVWNIWRAKNPSIKPDLSETNLSGNFLGGANFSRVNFKNTNFRGAKLADVNFNGADLNGAEFSKAEISNTSFDNVDLSQTIGLDEVIHHKKSTIGFDTIFLSNGIIPEVFLRGCGHSDLHIEIAKLAKRGLNQDKVTEISYRIHELYMGGRIQYYSCFISYNVKDEVFARKLHADLQDNGVRCWFAPEDLKIGDRIRTRIDQEIRMRDKLLVILSENSIKSMWVGSEVEGALEEERASSRTILYPIRLDKAVLNSRQDWSASIRRRRHIGDFSNWKNHQSYEKALNRLLSDLKVGP